MLKTKQKKTCRICKKEKDISSFYFRKDSNKYRNECKECCYNRNFNPKFPEEVKCIVCNKKILVKKSLVTTKKYCSMKCKKKNISKKLTKHGFHTRKNRERFYIIWDGIIQRCNNSNNPNYNYYGKRNIKICKRWLDFNNFRKDMYNSYLSHVKTFGEKNTQIDRINNYKGYNKSNCRWVTIKEQQQNKRKK